MSQFFCATCGEYKGLYPEYHTCPTQWLVRDPYYEGDEFDSLGRKYYAHDAEEAARKWAERTDPDRSYALVRGNEITVYVKKYDDPDDLQQAFEVSGEMVAEYSARAVKDSDVK